MLDTATKKRIDDCRDILVGKLPDPKSQIEQITIALIYKFMDDMDKETVELGGKPKFFSGEYAKYGWAKLFDAEQSSIDMVKLYEQALEQMELNPNTPQLFRDIFKNAYLPYRDPETLKLFLKTIGGFQYTHSEKLGDAFEYLLSVMGSQGDAGQFRTPRHIIDFIVEVVNPEKKDKILDPACGTSGFLVSAYKHILKSNEGKLTPDQRKRLMQNVVGYDISPDMVRLALVNLYLHGFSDPHIFEYDTLSSEERWDETYDVILANPPFMTPKGGIRPHKKFGVQSNRSEVLFVDYIAEHLNINGRAGVIVPEGIIFQSGTAYKSLRKMLVENYLWAVVSLPAGIFQPYSGVKTSILLMDKTLAKKTSEILFVKIESDGFDLGAQRRVNATSDLPEATKALIEYRSSLEGENTFESDNKNTFLVERKKIAKDGDYNLSIDRYRVSENKQQSNFEIVKLGDVVIEIKDGGTPSRTKDEYFGGTINWCVVKDIKPEIFDTKEKLTEAGLKNSSAKVWPVNSVIISLGATIGNIGITKIPTATKQGLSGIIVDERKILPKFLFYILQTSKELIQSFATGVTIKEVRPSKLKELLTFPLPPLSIQENIINKVESFQKIIDGAKQVVGNYKPQIDTDESWEMVKLGEVATFKNGINYTKDSNGSVVKVLGVRDFKNNLFAPLDSFESIQIDNILNENYELKKGDLVFVRSNGNQDLIGRCVLIPELNFKATFSGFTIRLRFNSEDFIPKFFAYLFKSDTLRNKLIDSGTGANIKSLNQTALYNLEIPLVPISIQKSIVTRIEQEQQLVNSKLWKAGVKEYGEGEEEVRMVAEE